MANFVYSTALANNPVNLDLVMSVGTEDVVDPNQAANNKYRIVFVKGNQTTGSTTEVWDYQDDNVQRDADYAALLALGVFTAV
jgi:hypothetical protein